MNMPSRKSIVSNIKESFLSPIDSEIKKNKFLKEKKWEEISTGPNCL